MKQYTVQYSIPGCEPDSMSVFAPNQWDAAVRVADQVRRDDDVLVAVHRVFLAVMEGGKRKKGKLISIDGKRQANE